MRIIEGLPSSPEARRLSAALGNFDGVHRGHQSVLAAAQAGARRLDAEFGAVTFEPHPRSVFQPDQPPFRLTPPALKARRMARLGVERLHVLPFDKALSGLSPEAFAGEILAEKLNLAHIVVGADFRFGKARAGDVDALRRLGEDLGFTVEALSHVGDETAGHAGEGAFSSSAVRAALRDGRPAEAARILGDWHRIEGVVEKGDQRGRDLGYPTANVSLPPEILRPAFGVYAVRVEICDGPCAGVHDGVASMGLRPMFELAAPNIETFLFDFSGDLYGATLSIGLVEYLRPEMKFDSLDALVAQMNADSVAARTALAKTDPPPWA